MTLQLPKPKKMRSLAGFLLLASLGSKLALAQTGSEPPRAKTSTCRVESVDYRGWRAQQLSNPWVQLIIVPQNGGRLMQVVFAGHPYLFVNRKYEGEYLPPSEGEWFNYGGDKLWLLPEGSKDEQHWSGGSDIIDDGPYSFRKVSEGQQCEVELTGPADPRTGIQFMRTIYLEGDSPRIRFRATMKNTTGHSVEWAMQSVSQYDTGDPNSANAAPFNRDFKAFAPAKEESSYLNRYHVRFGPAENPAASIREDGLFALRYIPMAAEVWLDSTAGWLALIDGSSHFGMVERFRFEEFRAYPGKASIICWTNGPEVKLSSDGVPSLTSGEDAAPYYMEAEINSPMCRLSPGQTCILETEWFPTRVGKEFHGVTDAGIVITPLQATRLGSGKLSLVGSFGVFFPGRLVAHFYDEHGSALATTQVTDVDPVNMVFLEKEITPTGKPARISLHLEDWNGLDRGSLQEVQVEPAK
jgi:hypothetical protein